MTDEEIAVALAWYRGTFLEWWERRDMRPLCVKRGDFLVVINQ